MNKRRLDLVTGKPIEDEGSDYSCPTCPSESDKSEAEPDPCSVCGDLDAMTYTDCDICRELVCDACMVQVRAGKVTMFGDAVFWRYFDCCTNCAESQ